MSLHILNLPDEILLQIISIKYNIYFDNYKNIRYLVRLSKVSTKFYDLCHLIKKDYLFFTINYISICNGFTINKYHYLFSKNVINNWNNLNIILSFNFLCDLKCFNIYKNQLCNYNNFHIAFNIENYIEEFIIFYNENKDFLSTIKYSINLYFHHINNNILIQHSLYKINNLFKFRNITFLYCRNLKIPNIIFKKLKIYNSKNITFMSSLNTIDKIYIKNSKHIIFSSTLENINLIHLKCCYNIIFNTIKNIINLKIIKSSVILNNKLENIHLLLIKISNNYFIIPNDSIIHKFIYLYINYINDYTIDIIKDRFNIFYSNIKYIEFIKSSST